MMTKTIDRVKKVLKWNRFVGVYEFRDVDRKSHIIVLTRNAVYEYDPTGKSTKPLFTLKEAEKATTTNPNLIVSKKEQ